MNQQPPAFEDHFSEKAGDYARYRPHYPQELFAYLASAAPARRLAWDCGTGSGQAALELARYFDRVIATDASGEQVAHAFPNARVEYRVEPAEEPSLDPGSADLITVAIAVHWFDLERFYPAVRRAAVEGGILAVWTYHLPVIEPAIDPIIMRYYKEVLAGYWPENFRYVDDRYQSLPFPFAELQPPEFKMHADWTLYQLMGFLGSWSASQKYQKAQGKDPIRVIWPELAEAWGDPEAQKAISWPLHLRVGRIE